MLVHTAQVFCIKFTRSCVARYKHGCKILTSFHHSACLAHPTYSDNITLLDPALLEHEVVYAAAGTPDRCFPIGSARLQAVTGAVPADFVVGDGSGQPAGESSGPRS